MLIALRYQIIQQARKHKFLQRKPNQLAQINVMTEKRRTKKTKKIQNPNLIKPDSKNKACYRNFPGKLLLSMGFVIKVI